MSGGQQQRVAIARALVGDAPIILADEPTGNLDTKTSHEIMNLLTELNAEGKTVIIVTHEPDVAEYTKRILHFRDGKLESDERKG
jgi:putative ABC transport system ATP-binding protein